MTSKMSIFIIIARLLRNVTKKSVILSIFYSLAVFFSHSAQTTITINLFVIYD